MHRAIIVSKILTIIQKEILYIVYIEHTKKNFIHVNNQIFMYLVLSSYSLANITTTLGA